MARIDLRTGQASADLIHKHYKDTAADWRRNHLGASMLGNRCDRFLWLSFRWAAAPDHSGRTLRLFERGKREEHWIICDLQLAGIRVRGEQRTVKWGHVGGSVDGIVTGLAEAPTTEHVLEVKTSSAKQFEYLKEKRVKSAKREHWIQMQVYMLGLGLTRAFYLAVNKDNDELYGERVDFDREAAQEAVDRGQRIVAMDTPPGRLDSEAPPCVLTSKDGTRYPCQFYDLCHGKRMPERNCRTCVDSTPLADGTWTCSRPHMSKVAHLDDNLQRSGCSMQRSIPPIVNAQANLINGKDIRYQFADGTIVEESDRP